MSKKSSTLGIDVKKSENMPEWYGQVIIKSQFADYAPVKGCMVIRPYGYACWENLVQFFDKNIKALKVKNAYFPLFIPESFFKKEAEHAEGFAPEVAWIENKDDNTAERLALRPTSETIMYDSYGKWIRSWRDLPLRINQWCNIVRWEVQDCKMFLRSREFLWQEGHCVYETEEECVKETLQYLEEYRRVAEELLAVPVMVGEKTIKERFAGAKATYSIEGMMPDGKALQMGTSHNLGQGFAKAFGIEFQNKEGNMSRPWQNSWGISTRMLGALIMTHGDDKGLVLPPNIAPTQIIMVPILIKGKEQPVLDKTNEIFNKFKDKFRMEVDDRDEYSPGWKFGDAELKGIPLRIAIGPRDLENDQVEVARRDTGEKEFVKVDELEKYLEDKLPQIQQDMFNKAKQDMESRKVEIESWDELMPLIKEGKMAHAPFCGQKECEEEIKFETGGVTTRNIALDEPKIDGICFKCGKKAETKCYFARNY